MRLAEYIQLSKEERAKVDVESAKSLIEAGKKLDKLGIWNIPKDARKRLKKGEELIIWEKKLTPPPTS